MCASSTSYSVASLTILNHIQGTGTVIGQANAESAISVAAVLYSNTPAYGVAIPTVVSFYPEVVCWLKV